MLVHNSRSLCRVLGALLIGFAFPAGAHGVHTDALSSTAPVIATGTVTELRVENRVTDQSLRYLGLRLDDGQSFTLVGTDVDSLATGTRIEATGVVSGQSFHVRTLAPISQSPKSVVADSQTLTTLSGTLAIYHKDFFDQGRGEYGFAIRTASGQVVELIVAVKPEWLEPGTAITADGVLAANGSSLDTRTLTVLAGPPAESNDVAAAPVTNTILVIPIRFSDTPAGDPFTGAAINTEFLTHVAPYYQEVSYGQQLLSINVACTTAPVLGGCTGRTDASGWLQSTSPTPADCDYTAIANLASAAATAAGYNTTVGQHQFVYFVLPSIASCGWAGLAYIGYGQAWSNGVNALWVYGHEIGHNFGLLHAGSLACSGQVIGGSCGVSEYGDPFDVMGNIRTGHFNSMQKAKLNWIPATSVKQHTTGTQTYQLSPIENGGQSVYAVSIQAAANRKYWVEFRQPIGFDAPISALPNLGAQIRLSGPSFEYGCGSCDDTELLDTTPGSSSGNSGFDDAAVLAGQTYTDGMYGISVHVISATTSLLTLSVTAPGATAAPSVSSAVSRKTHGAAGAFDLPLSLVPTNPTTEPRLGPTQTIVFDFGMPITSANVAVTEGTATASAPTFSGNTVIVNLSGVTNAQYVTVSLSSVAPSAGGTAGSGSVRIGFLAGDVTQNRVVTVADVATVNTVMAQAVSASNYLKDINASGTLTVADQALVNTHLSTALPAP